MRPTVPATVQLVGRGSAKLAPVHHLATGGEGLIFRLGDTIIKLYIDPDQMTREHTADKITRLAQLNHPYVVAPRGLVTDKQGQPIGLYMDYVDGEPLARVFTNDWRQRRRFGDPQASLLADRMRDVVHYAHSKGATMADANELNWTVVWAHGSNPEPRAIDVDSWAIGRWPARVIMPSIRDWQSTGPTQSSDWFAWGIVTFQLYTGIHPYKGTLKGYKPGELVRRMQDNASVFSSGIRLNRAVRDFGCIPGPLIDWYKAVFQDGHRDVPPSPMQAAPAKIHYQPTLVTVAPAGSLNYQLLYQGTTDPATRAFACGVAELASGRLYDLATSRIIGTAPGPNAEVIAVEGGWLTAFIDQGLVKARFIARSLHATDITPTLAARQLMRSNNRLFAVTSHGLTELVMLTLGQPIVTAGQTWGALPSTKWFDGIGVQDALGAAHLIIPFGDNACSQVRVPELDGLKVITAVGGSRFASITTLDSQGLYRQFELSLDRAYRQYTVTSALVDSPELNLAILPRGVCASITNDGELVIYVPSSSKAQRLSDQGATTALRLSNWGEAVVGLRDGHVYRLQLQ